MTAVPSHGRIIAVDWGEKRIGLATCDETQTIASPLGTLTRRTGKRFPMPRFLEHVTHLQPVGIVVGLPLESGGQDGHPATEARALAVQLSGRTGLPVELVDERMSTARVHAARRDAGDSGRLDREAVDALAAVVILEQFLAGRRPRPQG